MERDADLTPAIVGKKVEVMVWLAPAPKVAVVGDTVNLEASGPPTVMPVTDKLALPEFVMANVSALFPLTSTLSKFIVLADKLMPGAGGCIPFPVTGMDLILAISPDASA